MYRMWKFWKWFRTFILRRLWSVNFFLIYHHFFLFILILVAIICIAVHHLSQKHLRVIGDVNYVVINLENFDLDLFIVFFIPMYVFNPSFVVCQFPCLLFVPKSLYLSLLQQNIIIICLFFLDIQSLQR